MNDEYNSPRTSQEKGVIDVSDDEKQKSWEKSFEIRELKYNCCFCKLQKC